MRGLKLNETITSDRFHNVNDDLGRQIRRERTFLELRVHE